MPVSGPQRPQNGRNQARRHHHHLALVRPSWPPPRRELGVAGAGPATGGHARPDRRRGRDGIATTSTERQRARLERLAAMGRFASAATTMVIVGAGDGRTAHPLVDEAAHHAGTVATIAITSMQQPTTAAGTGLGEGSGRHQRDSHRQTLLPRCRRGRPPSIARRGDDRARSIQYHGAAAWREGDDAPMAGRPGTDAPSGRGVCPPVAAAPGDGAGRLSRLWDAAGGLSARLGLGAAWSAVGLPRLRDHAVRSVADQPPPRSRCTAHETRLPSRSPARVATVPRWRDPSRVEPTASATCPVKSSATMSPWAARLVRRAGGVLCEAADADTARNRHGAISPVGSPMVRLDRRTRGRTASGAGSMRGRGCRPVGVMVRVAGAAADHDERGARWGGPCHRPTPFASAPGLVDPDAMASGTDCQGCRTAPAVVCCLRCRAEVCLPCRELPCGSRGVLPR
jgi:hypothetical protein